MKRRRNRSSIPTKFTSIAQIELRELSVTGKSLSEGLLFAEHGENMLCTEIVSDIQNNVFSPCSEKRRPSDKDLPLRNFFVN